jgi:hypothetical protein
VKTARANLRHAGFASTLTAAWLCCAVALAQTPPPSPASAPAPAAAPAQPAPTEGAIAEPAPAAAPTEAAPAQPAPPPPAPPAFEEPAPAQPAPAEEPSYDYAPIEEPPPARKARNPFGQGTFNLSLLLGIGTGFNENYLILGGGPGYYVLDGLELELAAEVWLIGDPTIGKLTPGVRYVLHFVPVLKPYVGGFYRYTMIEDPYSNVSSLGVRFGAYYVNDSPVVIGAGAVYEHYLDSKWDPYWYPEISILVVF